MKNNIIASLVAVFAVLPFHARAELKVGDAAPKIQVSKWVQGGEVKAIEKGRVYVVEFWATWCGPCVAGIPHLDELHEKLKDKGVVVIGQNVWEEDTSGVAPFVKKMGEKMSYRVALDDTKDGKGFMAENWLAAAGQNGIPCAFVVDKESHIVWIGHPGGLKEEMLQEVVDGKFDVKKARENAEKSEKDEKAMASKFEALDAAIDAKDWKKADGLVDEISKVKPEMATSIRFGLALMKKDPVEAVKQAKAMAEGEIKDDPEGLNALAWGLVTEIEKPGKELLDAAADLARKAVVLSKDEPAVLDTLARIQFLQGSKDEAVKTLEKAIAKTDDEDLKGQLKLSLESMKKGELPKIQEETMEAEGE